MRRFRSRRARGSAAVLALGTVLFAGALGLAARSPAGAAAPHLQPGGGYDLVAADGGVFTFGDAAYEGSLPALGVKSEQHQGDGPIPRLSGLRPRGLRRWGVRFGDYPFRGNAAQNGIAATDLVGLAITEQVGRGIGGLLAGADGGVFTIAGAQFEGSLPGFGIHVTNIVGIAATADNKGYWLAGSDGGIFSFGDAPLLRPAAPGLESGGRHRRHLRWPGPLGGGAEWQCLRLRRCPLLRRPPRFPGIGQQHRRPGAHPRRQGLLADRVRRGGLHLRGRAVPRQPREISALPNRSSEPSTQRP